MDKGGNEKVIILDSDSSTDNAEEVIPIAEEVSENVEPMEQDDPIEVISVDSESDQESEVEEASGIMFGLQVDTLRAIGLKISERDGEPHAGAAQAGRKFPDLVDIALGTFEAISDNLEMEIRVIPPSANPAMNIDNNENDVISIPSDSAEAAEGDDEQETKRFDLEELVDDTQMQNDLPEDVTEYTVEDSSSLHDSTDPEDSQSLGYSSL